MNFDITKVTIDGAVDDLSEDQLRELVSKFEDAQESNVAEFERAAEEMPEIKASKIEDFEKAREGLIGEIAGAEAFDEVPVTEDALEDCSFGELQEWDEFVSEKLRDDSDGDFDDFGRRSPEGEGDETDFADEELENVPGLQL
jgi:hypothetical protein